MIPFNNPSLSGKEKKQIKQFRNLGEQQQSMLLEFAAFLHSRIDLESEEPEPVSEPLDIPRPEEESVVKAIKRLSATYPMVAKDKILNQTSSLMAQHIMQGRDAEDIIDELEEIFRSHYTALTAADD